MDSGGGQNGGNERHINVFVLSSARFILALDSNSVRVLQTVFNETAQLLSDKIGFKMARNGSR